MRIAFFHSLAVRLAGLILLLSGLTLLILTEINRRAVERILGEQAEVQAAMAISAVSDGLEAGVGATERLVRFLARDLEGRTLTSAEVERLARNALVDAPSVFACSITFEPRAFAPATDRFGRRVQRSNAPTRFITRDLTTTADAYWERDWYREAIDKGQAVWGEPFRDAEAERNLVRLAVPFFHNADDEKPAGVVAVLVELDWLRRLANTNEFSDTSHVIVFSRTGRLILHPKPSFVIAETMETLADKLSAPEVAAIRQSVIARRQGSVRYRDGLTGRWVRANYKPARVAGWGVVVGYDEAEFLKGQRAFRGTVAAFLVATLLILGGIVIGVTRYALRPLGPLAAAAGEIARGQLDGEIPAPARADEIGQLTKAFRAMRDALKAQHLERSWAAQSIEHQLKYNQLIIDSIGELVFVLTKALNISRINPAVTRTTGYASADLVKMPLARIIRLDAKGDDATSLAPLAAALSAGRGLEDVAAVIIAKDDVTRAVRLTLAPLFDNNRVVGAVVTVRVSPPDPLRQENASP
jgi:sigma-B regulation protein RsbU (phosphoserine phosphatase)